MKIIFFVCFETTEKKRCKMDAIQIAREEFQDNLKQVHDG